MSKILSAKEWIEKRCFEEELKHSISLEGILIESDRIDDEMQKYAEYYHTEKIRFSIKDISAFSKTIYKCNQNEIVLYLRRLKKYLNNKPS